MINSSFYFDVFYPFQDRVLEAFDQVDTGFYLTGGTAASRGYLGHRFSDDLDFFVNDDNRFGLWLERIIQALSRTQAWTCEVFPADLARVLCSATRADWEAVRWLDAPPPDVFLSQLNELGEKLLLL
ncbi:MAG: nucleotidyl transferase AbiEii/AbiGii toxin family protein [Chloroflexi bacterium]|nr:nucleotidyl transferase AbiEii/AbiGii toxin family protein [Chloroflexota bacterium]